MDDISILQERIRNRLAEMKVSARSISMKAFGKPDVINNVLNKGAMPTGARLLALAEELETTPNYLLGRDNNPHMLEYISDVPPSPLPPARAMPQDIPVYGTALGSDAHFDAVAIEQTDLNTGEVIDFFRRPPALDRNRKVYGLYIVGASMDPAFAPGSSILVDPSRPPSIRDYVVVYLRGEGDEATAALIKRLVRRTADMIELEQFNPPATFSVLLGEVLAMHRVLTLSDVLGM